MLFCFAILTHNRSASLLALLESLNKLIKPVDARYCIYIWDNASHADHTTTIQHSVWLQSRADVFYRRSEQNEFMVGKLRLEDWILAETAGESDAYLIHLDDDVQLSPNWLHHTWTALQVYPWAACGSVEEWNQQTVFSGQTRLNFSDEQINQERIRLWEWRWEVVLEMVGYSAAEFVGHRAMLVQMELARHVRHDSHLLIGGEDLDYSLSLRQAGGTLGIAHAARIQHRGLNEQDAAGFRTPDKVLQSWRYFYAKWGFVRRNANSEAGLSFQDWLRAFL